LLDLPLPERCTILALLLLLLLMDLFRKLLELSTLLDAVVLGVMHQSPQATAVADGRLSWVLVAAWATTPTCHCSYNIGSTGQLLVLAADCLLLLLVAALGSSIYVMLASFPYLWSRL
jgi:hypothetical protein